MFPYCSRDWNLGIFQPTPVNRPGHCRLLLGIIQFTRATNVPEQSSIVHTPPCQTEVSAITCNTLGRYLLTCFESVCVRKRCGISLNQSSFDFGRLNISSSRSSSRSRPLSAAVSENST